MASSIEVSKSLLIRINFEHGVGLNPAVKEGICSDAHGVTQEGDFQSTDPSREDRFRSVLRGGSYLPPDE